MASSVRLYGATAVYVALSVPGGSSPSGAIALLGYSVNGVEVEEESYVEEVHGDQNGGDAGPPIEIVEHGEVHRIRMTLSRWDETVLAVIRTAIYAGAQGGSFPLGTPPSAGTLVFGNTGTFRLVLSQA